MKLIQVSETRNIEFFPPVNKVVSVKEMKKSTQRVKYYNIVISYVLMMCLLSIFAAASHHGFSLLCNGFMDLHELYKHNNIIGDLIY